jgi:hypothetical protein
MVAFDRQDVIGSTPTFDVNMDFDNFDHMCAYVTSYTKMIHFKISVNSSTYKNGIAMRGYFYCSPKSSIKDKSNPQSKNDCQCIFNLNFNKSQITGKNTFSKPKTRFPPKSQSQAY